MDIADYLSYTEIELLNKSFLEALRKEADEMGMSDFRVEELRHKLADTLGISRKE